MGQGGGYKPCSQLALYQPVLITDPGHLFSSWKECHHLIIAGEATETWTNPVALPHYAIGGVGVGLPEGKALVIGIFQGYFKHQSVDVQTSWKENANLWRLCARQCINCYNNTTHETSVANILMHRSVASDLIWAQAVFEYKLWSLTCFAIFSVGQCRWPQLG